jgi:O-acetyl-ADP-ribose deacetylase (regulator of RNase III)
MIEEARGNLLQADPEALVNTVNTVGFMGKGIALQFKQAFPGNFRAYAQAVKRGEVQPGRMLVVPTGFVTNPRFIINFPTKRHWRGRSRIEDIEAGLKALVEEIRRLGLRSIAIPPLGCGNGGLEWADVRPRIEKALQAVPDVRVLLFAPRGAPAAESMPVRTRRPPMTAGRALIVKLMEQYLGLDYRLTLLEMQKLAYFLQEAGEPLRLRYEAGHYGPYAANLNKALERMEGHLIRGYGDSQKPDVEVHLLSGATEEAAAFLATRPDSRARLTRVGQLIEGFETPHGMELLSTVHWVGRYAGAGGSPEAAIKAVHSWNERKRKMFSPSHVRVAWQQLKEGGWLQGESEPGGSRNLAGRHRRA